MYIQEGETMGSAWSVQIAQSVSDIEAQLITAGLRHILQLINQSMSTYIPDSEIERFGDYQGREPFAISLQMRTVVEKALQICAHTEGRYDITVAPLVNMWGFGSTKTLAFPDARDVQTALKAVDYRKVRLLPQGIIKEDPNLRLDLSSIAKGFAVDKIAEFLNILGFTHHFVSIGGELRMGGNNRGQSWKVGVEKPFLSDEIHFETVFGFRDVALGVATSGGYRHFRELGGQVATHEIHPQTGQPVISKLLSATVFADDCMTADGYATALFILGDEALAFADANQIPALLMYADENADTGYQCQLTKSLSWLVYKQ